jgi:transcription antitermination factor NusG
MAEKRRWYALYTKPRWEKKVHQLLEQKGIESYCPLNKVKRKWSDRIKLIEEPLFKSYVFVHLTEEERATVRMTSGVMNFVYWLGKPAIIRDREIAQIKRFLNEHQFIELQHLQLKEFDKVRIETGVFMNREATVTKVLKKKVVLTIESLGYQLIALTDTSQLSLIEK